MLEQLEQKDPLLVNDDLQNKIDRISVNLERFHSILTVINLGVILQGPNAEALVCNDSALRMLDIEEEEIIGKQAYELGQWAIHRDGSRFPPEDFPVYKALKDFKAVHNVLIGFLRPLKKDIIWLSINDDLIFNQDGSIKYVICSMLDVSDQIRTEMELKFSEDKWRFALEGNGDGVWDWDIKCSKTYYSKSYLQMLGFSNKDLITENLWEDKIHPEDRERVIKRLNDHISGSDSRPYSIEFRMLCKDGTYKWILARGKIMSRDLDGTPTRMIGTHTDISESKRALALLHQSLIEKDVLLSEIHHRVKNNMAVVSGLLSLQEGYLNDSATKALFVESQNRIKTMALIHEKLYQSDDFTHIGFDGYIRDLVQTIEYSYGSLSKTIHVQTEIFHAYLDLNTAVPCALILNELLSNAYKHAFTDKNNGTIIISFIKEEEIFYLIVSDNGKGVDLSKIKNSQSLGFTLVQALVKQIKAELTISSERGTRIQIKFKVPAPIAP